MAAPSRSTSGRPIRTPEAYATLVRIRAAHGELYQRIERHNAQHVRPAEYDQVVVYAGQHVLSTHATEASEVKS